MSHSRVKMFAALLISACSPPSDSPPASQAPGASAQSAEITHHVDRPGQRAFSSTMEYFGGRVIPNAKVYAVWWGTGADLNSDVTKARGGIADFFAGVLDSNFLDGLNEYDTDITVQAGAKKGAHGTGQHIGRGNFAGTIALTAIPAGNVTDDQIQAAIEAAIASGALPQPDDNSIYAIFFPSSVEITVDGSTSCGAYLAYHSSTPESQHHAAYAVMPDCGDSFSSLTVTTSHELVEAITDAIPTPGSNPDYPQAWNTADGSETGDLCEGSAGNIATAFGTFHVQGIWDELSHSCKVTHTSARDYAVAAQTTGLALQAGSQGTVTFQTTTVAGAAQPLTLSISAPQGVTAVLASATVNSGATVSVALTLAPDVNAQDAQIVLRAVGTNGAAPQSHTAAALVRVTH